MARFIDEGWLARHIRKTRAEYEARHDLIVQAVTDRLRVVPSIAGLHVSATADALSPDELAAVVRRALAVGVVVPCLSMFRVSRPVRSGLVFGYGNIYLAHIEEGLQRLAESFGQR